MLSRNARWTGILWYVTLVFLRSIVAAADPPPNVVLILSDDQAWTDYGFMGHDTIRTPNLDRLAAESLTLTRGYVPSSLCRPSLMSIITGLYPHQHRVVGNDPPKGTDRNEMLRHVRRLNTLPKLLAAKGYQCLQTGKWWEGNFREGGFTHGMTHGDPANRGRHGDVGLEIGRQGMQPIVDFLDNRREKPFCIWYAPMLPHSPHNPPERLLAKYRDKVDSIHVARYFAMCEWFDESIGELMKMLDERGLRDNTIVVYVTDNGWIQNPNTPQFAPRSKRSPYDGGLRTPIMVRWPKRLKAKRDETTPISSIDIAPTILAACGLPVPSDLLGVNLLDIADGRVPARDALFGAIYEHDVVSLDDPRASLVSRWCLADEWKLIVPVGDGPVELFQIKSDPMEQQNVAARHPETVARLTAKLTAWWPDGAK